MAKAGSQKHFLIFARAALLVGHDVLRDYSQSARKGASRFCSTRPVEINIRCLRDSQEIVDRHSGQKTDDENGQKTNHVKTTLFEKPSMSTASFFPHRPQERALQNLQIRTSTPV